MVLRVLRRFFDALFAVAMVVAQVLMVAMVLLIFVNVFMRYVLRSGITWSEEIALVMAVWFIFIAMALGVRKNLHISIHLFRNPPPMVDRALQILQNLAVLAVGWVMLRYGWRLVEFTSRSIMPATELPSSVLYLIMPFAAVLIMYEAVMDLLGIETDTLSAAEQEED